MQNNASSDNSISYVQPYGYEQAQIRTLPPNLRSISTDSGESSTPTSDLQGPTSAQTLRSRSSFLKQKQRRNKPTLSCAECVERKTKCDRARPRCLACLKRSSGCDYSDIANVLDNARPEKIRKTGKLTTDHVGPSRVSITNITPIDAERESRIGRSFGKSPREPVALSGLPSALAPISVFGTGSSHPFANYWTANGGLAEVIAVLPSKEQADILIKQFFEIVDPVYPIIDRAEFLATYEIFWSLTEEAKAEYNADIIALHLVLYATATQFFDAFAHAERQKTSEFYMSAAHQALQMSSYWSHITIPTIQAMCLTFNWLVNDNYVNDAWTFCGILLRQAQVLQLHRDPQTLLPDASAEEQHLRCVLWQMVVSQDIGICLFLKLPPATSISDVTSASFDIDFGANAVPKVNHSSVHSSVPLPILPMSFTITDLAYSKSIWQIFVFIQDNICKSRTLGEPVCNSPQHKIQLVEAFRRLHAEFPSPFSSHEDTMDDQHDLRLVRQQLAIRNNFYHTLMLIQSEENRSAGTTIDFMGTLETAHLALESFFELQRRFGKVMDGFWAYQHRNFEVAVSQSLVNFQMKPQADKML